MSDLQIFRQILRTQWAWTRLVLITTAVGSFVAPTFIWWLAGPFYSAQLAPLAIINGFQTLGPALGLVALVTAFILAAQPWVIDAATRHVYPLSLPIAWRRYVALRYAAGALTLLLPAAALYLGSLFVIWRLTLPEVLRAYPLTLAVRYLLAMLVGYSATFALQWVFGRRAPIVVLVTLLAFLTLGVGLTITGHGDVIEWVGTRLVQWPGPLAVFAEPWRLIDV